MLVFISSTMGKILAIVLVISLSVTGIYDFVVIIKGNGPGRRVTVNMNSELTQWLEENLEKKRELWTYIKNRDIRLFHKLRNRIMGQTLNLPGKGGRKLSLTIYKISQKVIGFN